MIPLNERVIRLREKALNWNETQRETIGQRMLPALAALASCPPDLPWVARKSRMLAQIILQSETVVYDDELLVGYNYFGSDSHQWLEVSLPKPLNGDKDKIRDYLESGHLHPKQIDFALNTLESFDTLIPSFPTLEPKPDFIPLAEQEGIFWTYCITDNHTVLGYEKVLTLGFEGIAAQVRQKLAAQQDLPAPARVFLHSLLEVAEAAACIGSRYAARVRQIRATCDNPSRAAELESIQQVLERVPAQPARTFHEAVQSLWFAHIINTWEDGINANSLGRLDQILYPYYRKDIDEGRITPAEAFELICCLWVKLYRDYDVQQSCVGGLTPEGRDGTNELSFLMLDATEALDFVRCLSVRLHKDSPPALLRRSLEIVGTGKGIPFFFNDEVLIPALVDHGIALEDARDYAAIGCVEITIPGRANPHAVSNRINLLKCLELALNDGKSMVSGEQVGPQTGSPDAFTTIEHIITAYEQQVAFFVDRMSAETLRLHSHYRLSRLMPYKSLLTEGCLESARDFNDQGARYDYHESMPMGIPNVADSLAALQKMVFEERKYTLSALLEELKLNFPRETIRQDLLRRAPKYGNDDDSVDSFAVRVFQHYCDQMREVSEKYQTAFFAQPFTFLWLVEAGERTAATPDGRKKGDNLAYSISPMQGRDFRGLTALINSLAKLPQHLAPGSTSAIVEIEPGLFSEANIGHLTTLLQTSVEKGVGQLQFNVVNAETLRKAQAEPDKYRSLAVRVSGFSQRFCLLDRKLQDHIIARTKHGKL
jgi:pyruvate formate-lyase/glycerol dehydratase family glycyl radical enzyme